MSQPKFNAYNHLQVSLNPDGSLTRHLRIPLVSPTGDDNDQLSAHAVVTKDISLDAAKSTTLRIFRLTKVSQDAKLPIILYFHAGGWIDFHPASAMVHSTCTDLATEIPAVVVSVGVRLAPESRLRAQYENALDALMWLRWQAEEGDGEEWMRELVDFSRCYLFGMGSGGNVVFNAGVRVTDMDLGPVKINGLVGLIMNQPMFGGVKRTKEELKHATDELMPLPAVDLYWELALPPGTNRDHHYSNPLVDGPHRKKIGLLGRCLVIGFNDDLMIDRQQAFVQMLVLKGVQVEARFDITGFHGIDLVDPRRGAAVLNFIKEFV